MNTIKTEAPYRMFPHGPLDVDQVRKLQFCVGGPLPQFGVEIR